MTIKDAWWTGKLPMRDVSHDDLSFYVQRVRERAEVKMSNLDSDITPHFTWKEAACPCGCVMPLEVVSVVRAHAHHLETIRMAVGSPLDVNSWYRCPKHNAEIVPPGVPNSRHIKGDGTDLKSAGLGPGSLYMVIVALINIGQIPDGEVLTYSDGRSHVHYSSAGVRYRAR